MSDVMVTFHGLHVDGDCAIVEETMTATLANGNHYTNDYCFVFELRNGLVHRVREYMDTARGQHMIFGGDVVAPHGSVAATRSSLPSKNGLIR